MSQEKPKLDQKRLDEIKAKFKLDDDVFKVVLKCCVEARSPDEISLFCHIFTDLKLSPVLDQIHFVPRNKWIKDGSQWKPVPDDPTIQIGIGGLRLLADRTGEYCGSDAPVFHYVIDETDPKVLSGPVYPPSARCVAVTTTVYRAPGKDPSKRVGYSHTAFLSDYVQETTTGVTKMWKKIGIMLPKCSEAGAIRKGFPDIGQLYVPEEILEVAEEHPAEAAPKVAAPKVPEPPPTDARTAALAEERKEPEKKPAPAPVPVPAPEPATQAGPAPAAEEKRATSKELATEIVEYLRDSLKEKAGEAVKFYVAHLCNATSYDKVRPDISSKTVRLLHGEFKADPGEVAKKIIANYEAKKKEAKK